METLIPISFFVCVAAVLILRPITRRLGGLLEQIALDRKACAAGNADNGALRQSLEHLNQRLALIEERLDFTERLISVERVPRIARNRTAGEERAGFLG